jgi:hypothetical protein
MKVEFHLRRAVQQESPGCGVWGVEGGAIFDGQNAPFPRGALDLNEPDLRPPATYLGETPYHRPLPARQPRLALFQRQAGLNVSTHRACARSRLVHYTNHPCMPWPYRKFPERQPRTSTVAGHPTMTPLWLAPEVPLWTLPVGDGSAVNAKSPMMSSPPRLDRGALPNICGHPTHSWSRFQFQFP